MTWNKWCCRSPLCTCRLNWARRTSWRWWDEWDDTALQTQNSEFEPWRSEAEHAASRSWRLPTTSNIHEWAGKKHVVSSKLKCQIGVRARDLRLSKQAASTTTPRPLPHSVIAGCISHYIVSLYRMPCPGSVVKWAWTLNLGFAWWSLCEKCPRPSKHKTLL